MPASWTEITSVDQLEPLLSAERDAVVLFQHDPYCPISLAAYQQMRRLTELVFLVDVSRFHDVSETIEARTGIRHESPQVIVLKHGAASWSASHYAITQQAVDQALR